MRWLRWTQNVLRSRRRRRAPRPDHLTSYQPQFYRLEDRRVLDASAAFSSATGQLDLLLANSAETVSISIANGNITLRDSQQQAIAIDVDGNGPGTVNASAVDSIHVVGDAAPNQKAVFDASLSLPKGLFVESSIEVADVNFDLIRIDQGTVQIDALRIELGADILTADQEIRFGGAVVLTDSVRLIGTDVTFAASVDDDGQLSSPSDLIVEAGGTTRFGGIVGGASALDRLETDSAGKTELNGNVTARGNTVFFADPVLLTNDVAISDSASTGIIFGSTIDSAPNGNFNLELSASNGAVRFNGNIGAGTSGDQRLGDLTIHQAASGVAFGDLATISELRLAGALDVGTTTNVIGGDGIVLSGGSLGVSLSVAGRVRLNGAMALGSDVALVTTNSDITFTSAATIDSQLNVASALKLNAGSGAVFFNADIGSILPVRGLSIDRADGGVIFGAADTANGIAAGPVKLVNSVETITIGSAASPILGGIRLNAGVGQTLQITTTNDAVTFHGPVTLGSDVAISTGSGPGDIRFRSGTINSQVGEANDLTLNAGAGATEFSRDIGATTALGAFSIVQADAGVVLGTADVVGAGLGPVTQVRAASIDIGQSSNDIGPAGIRFNAGAPAFSLTSTSGDIRLNGPVVLDSDLTISSAGDVTFTNDSPINSQTAEVHSLIVTAGSGMVSFNEDIGALVPLNLLTIISAADGVIFGGANNEVPGSGGLGPVEILRLNGSLDVGVGANVIGGAGIVLSGSAIAPLRVSTTDDAIRINGAVTLQTDVEISSGNTGANIKFTNAASIDSGVTRRSNLTLNAGTAAIEFNEDIGSVREIGTLNVVQAIGGVIFGAADIETATPDLVGPVERLHTDGPVLISFGAIEVEGKGIVFNAGPSEFSLKTTGDQIWLNGPVWLQSDLDIQTTGGIAGSVAFTPAATINSQDGPGLTTTAERNDLTVTSAQAIFFDADIGVVQRIGEFTIEQASGVVFGSDNATTIFGPGIVTEVHTDGAIDFGAGSSAQDRVVVVFNAGPGPFLLETTGDSIRFNGHVTLQSDLTIETGPGAANLTFTPGTGISSETGTTQRLEVSLDQGDARFGGFVGVLEALVLHSVRNAEFEDTVSVLDLIQESGTGETVFHDTIFTNRTNSTGISLTGNAFRFEQAVTSGRVLIEHTGSLEIGPAADFRIDSTFTERGGTVELAGDIATSGDVVEFNSPVVFGAGTLQTLLSTVAGGQAAGADIRFLSTANAQTAGIQNLLFNAGTNGDVQFAEGVGNAVRLGSLTFVEAADVQFQDSLTASRIVQLNGQGTTAFSGTIDLNHATLLALDLKTHTVTFNAPLTTSGHGGVRISVGTALNLADAANFSLNGAFEQLGGGTVFTAANISTTADHITFDSAVLLRDDVRLDTGTGFGSIHFRSEVDSDANSLHDLILGVDTGDVTFDAEVGASTSLDRLHIESAHDVTFLAEVHVNSLLQTAGTGTTSWLSDVTSTGSNGIEIHTSLILAISALNATANPLAPILLAASEDIQLSGEVRTIGGLLTLSAGGNVLLGGEAQVHTTSAKISVLADSDQAGGGAVFMADGSTVDSGTAEIEIAATGNITIGRLLSTLQIRLASKDGAILDGGDLGGADIVTPVIRLEAARGIGTDAIGSGKDAVLADPLETEVRFVAAANSTTGGIHLFNRAVDTLTISTIDGLVGLTNGGAGLIDISQQGTLLVNQPILSDGGGSTRLRAEIPGDLIVNQPIQNTGGNGSIFLFSGGDLIIRNSLPEPPGKIEHPTSPADFFEIMVSGEGAVRGEARKNVIVDDGDVDYVIIRTASGQITNVQPIVTIRTLDQGGSDIDEQGRGFVEVTIGDNVHLETNYHIQIDWGDGEIESFPIPGTIHPDRLPGSTEPRFISGDFGLLGTREPGLYVFTHKYFSHPNPNDPAAPIPIRVELRHDARASGEASIDANRPVDGSAIFNGIRFANNVSSTIFTSVLDTFSVPGTGGFTFVKVVESVIVPVEVRAVSPPPPVQTAVSFAGTGGLRSEFRASRFEAQTQLEYRLFMKVVDDVLGKELDERIELNLELLSDPLSLFRTRRFPNGHYRIYLEEVRTRRLRLILDVHIFDGRVVPPNFKDVAGEKQPGVEQEASPMQPAQPNPDDNGFLKMNGEPGNSTAFPVEKAVVRIEPIASPTTGDERDVPVTEEVRSLTRISRLLRSAQAALQS